MALDKNDLKLFHKLVEIMRRYDEKREDGELVYFNPPDGITMTYPCITVRITDRSDIRADDIRYFKNKTYTVQVIDPDPTSEIAEMILDEINFSRFNTNYYTSNLYFTILLVQNGGVY